MCEERPDLGQSCRSSPRPGTSGYADTGHLRISLSPSPRSELLGVWDCPGLGRDRGKRPFVDGVTPISLISPISFIAFTGSVPYLGTAAAS